MNHRFACLASVALLCCIIDATAWGDSRPAQTQENIQERTFKVSTELVEVRAVVTDRDGRIVEDLEKEDFELLENGRPQEISFFSVSQVGERQDKPAASNIPSQHKGSRSGGIRERLSAPPARSTILYVDNLHLTFSNLNWIKQSLHRFLDEKMTDQDMIALVTSDGTLGVAQQFTRNRRVLRHAIEQIRLGPISWETPFSATLAGRILRNDFDFDALEEGKQKLQAAEHIEDKFGSLTRARARSILSGASYFRETMLLTLEALIDQMTGMPGQRMIAIFSEGFTQDGRDGWPKYDEVGSVINRAARSGIVIYSIDGNALSYETPDPQKQAALITLAKDTGGEFYQNSNNLSGALGRAFDANRFYYTLGYYLKPGSDAGKFRSIKVRIRDHPDYNVRTPKGYLPSDLLIAKGDETAKTPQQRLLQAMKAPLPVTDFGVSARADFLETETDDKQVTLTVYFDGDRFKYREQGQLNLIELEIVYVVYDSSGKQVDGTSAHVEGRLTPVRLTQARISGYRFSRRLMLKPGVYQVRIGVREEGTSRMGTAAAWVEVPKLAQNKPEMSSLILGNLLDFDIAGAEGINVGSPEQIKMAQSIPLFARNNTCAFAFRVYRSVDSPAGSNLVMKMELLRSGKSIRQDPWQPLPENGVDLNGKLPLYVRGKVNLAGLDSDMYELSVSVKEAQSKKTAQRTAVFGIE